MVAIDELVPEFTQAVASVADNALTWQALSLATRRSSLGPRAVALVRVAVAQRVGCDYGKWVMERLAARQGVSAQEIFFAGIGVADSQDENAVVRAAVRLATRDLREMKAVYADLAGKLGPERAGDVLSHVSLAIFACDILDSIAPGTADASARTRQAGD
jgi:hypothetical protein